MPSRTWPGLSLFCNLGPLNSILKPPSVTSPGLPGLSSQRPRSRKTELAQAQANAQAKPNSRQCQALSLAVDSPRAFRRKCLWLVDRQKGTHYCLHRASFTVCPAHVFKSSTTVQASAGPVPCYTSKSCIVTRPQAINLPMPATKVEAHVQPPI